MTPDLIDVEPTGQTPGLFSVPGAAFAVIWVKPDLRLQYRERPAMPLVPRGYLIEAGGSMWTVLRGHIGTSALEGGDGESYYWYAYEAVRGKHVLD